MTLNIFGHVINNIQVIDDSPSNRQAMRMHVNELEVDAHEVDGGIVDVSSLMQTFDRDRGAVICDYNLKLKNYSKLDGDEIVAGLYRNTVPAVLCTRIDADMPPSIRRNRRQIPVIIRPADLEGESISEAFGICLMEFKGTYESIRKPWRTMIRIEGGGLSDSKEFIKVHAVIPEWDSALIYFEWRLDGSPALNYVRDGIEKHNAVRIYATVNVGAESAHDLYVDELSIGRSFRG